MPFLEKTFLRTISYYYRIWYKANMHYKTWMNINRKTSAKVDPFSVIFIDPSNINYSTRNHKAFDEGFFPELKSGCWDQNIDSLFREKSKLHSSFKERFINDVDWEETEYFNLAKEILYKEGRWKECSNYDELQDKFRSYDKIYKNICKKGYQTQRELEKNGEIENNSMPLGLYVKPPEIREVTIDIGRNGEYIWHSGAHRIIIASILDIERIPVRIRGRHEKWQTKREEYLTGEYTNITHPDLPPIEG